MNRKDFEIMAPVGSYESLYAAINAVMQEVGAVGKNKQNKEQKMTIK